MTTHFNFNMQDQYLTIVRGDTFSIGVVVEGLEGQDLDTAFFSCKKNITEETVFQKSLNDGITKNSDGRYIIRVAPEDTNNIEVGKYFYDFEVGLNGDRFTILRGVLELLQDITREV